eukprot:3472620-Rhodomonas_salina.2
MATSGRDAREASNGMDRGVGAWDKENKGLLAMQQDERGLEGARVEMHLSSSELASDRMLP